MPPNNKLLTHTVGLLFFPRLFFFVFNPNFFYRFVVNRSLYPAQLLCDMNKQIHSLYKGTVPVGYISVLACLKVTNSGSLVWVNLYGTSDRAV